MGGSIEEESVNKKTEKKKNKSCGLGMQLGGRVSDMHSLGLKL